MGGQADLVLGGLVFNLPFGNKANILSLTPSKKASAYRITCRLGVAAKFGLTISDGTNTLSLGYLEDAATLTAGAYYTWTIGARSGYTYAFQADSAVLATIPVDYLSVEEVPSGEL